jgi:DNA-binding LacI/PurR family transcriptional regulator
MTSLPTLKVVAAYTNVSPTTVSNILNNKRMASFSKETIEKVLTAADELGYSSNRMITSLQKKCTQTIGIGAFKNPGDHPFLGLILNEISLQGGYDVLLYMAEVEKGRTRDNPKIFLDGRIDGLLLFETRESVSAAYLGRLGFPVVLLLKSGGYNGVACVNPDFLTIGRAAVDYLWERGHRRIAHLAGNVGLWDDAFRLEMGFRQRLAEFSPDFCMEMVYTRGEQSMSVDLCEKVISYWLSMPLDRRPTSVLVESAFAAESFMHAAKRQGLKIPDDLSLLAISNGLHETDTFTAIQFSAKKQAKLAVSSLYERIAGKKVEDCSIIIPHSIVDGSTVLSLNK